MLKKNILDSKMRKITLGRFSQTCLFKKLKLKITHNDCFDHFEHLKKKLLYFDRKFLILIFELNVFAKIYQVWVFSF